MRKSLWEAKEEVTRAEEKLEMVLREAEAVIESNHTRDRGGLVWSDMIHDERLLAFFLQFGVAWSPELKWAQPLRVEAKPGATCELGFSVEEMK